MHPDKYTLTWHSHPDYLREMMREMMTSDDFTDVTLVTDDKKTIKARNPGMDTETQGLCHCIRG